MNYLQSDFKLFPFIRERATILATAWLVFLSALLFLSIANVYPSILGDEFIYATQATVYGPYQESSYGSATSFAFDFLFSTTSICGPSFFYLCGKFLNVGLLLGLALYIFLLLKRSELGFVTSILAGSLIFVSPLAGYASFFMPEVLLMVLGTMAIILTSKFALMPNGKLLGYSTLALAIFSLTKFQGLVAAAAIVTFVFFLTLFRKLSLSWAIKFLLLAVIFRISLGFLFAGPRSFGVTGSYIEGVDNSSSSVIDLIPGAVSLLPEVLVGTGLVFLIGFLGMSIYILPFSAKDSGENTGNHDVRQLGAFIFQTSLFVFGALAALTVAFTIFVTLQGDSHVDRALLRYVEWLAIPFFLSAALLTRSSKLVRLGLPLTFAGIAAVSVPWYAAIRGQLVSSKISDSLFASSIIGGLSNLSLSLYLFFGLVIAVAILSIFAPTRLPALGATCVIGLALVTQNAWNLIDFRSGPNVADDAGQFARSYIGEQVDGSDIAILANTRFSATSAGIWLGKKDMYLPGGVITAGNLPKSELIPDQDWLLSIGDVSVEGPKELVVSGQGFTITKFGNKNILYLGRTSPQANVLISDSNLAYYPWGAVPISGIAEISILDTTKASKELVVTAKINDAVLQGQYAMVLALPSGEEVSLDLFAQGTQQFNFPIAEPSENLRIFIRDSASNQLTQGLFGIISIETR